MTADLPRRLAWLRAVDAGRVELTSTEFLLDGAPVTGLDRAVLDGLWDHDLVDAVPRGEHVPALLELTGAGLTLLALHKTKEEKR